MIADMNLKLNLRRKFKESYLSDKVDASAVNYDSDKYEDQNDIIQFYENENSCTNNIKSENVEELSNISPNLKGKLSEELSNSPMVRKKSKF